MITYSRLGLNGRFGNQLFQFAGTIGIAEKNGFDVVFPIDNSTIDGADVATRILYPGDTPVEND